MEPVYQDWEDAARRADNVQQEVIRITRVGLPAPLELLEQLASLENDLLAKLNALQNARTPERQTDGPVVALNAPNAPGWYCQN